MGASSHRLDLQRAGVEHQIAELERRLARQVPPRSRREGWEARLIRFRLTELRRRLRHLQPERVPWNAYLERHARAARGARNRSREQGEGMATGNWSG
jgi:hypothetical protein